jgi:hypothetical protein
MDVRLQPSWKATNKKRLPLVEVAGYAERS